jgi:hypothetical protein
VTFRFLASFHYHRDTDLAAVSAPYKGPVEVFADSGAFSAATTGATINLADYAAWLRHWDGLITTASTLDVIGDHQATARNTGELEARGLRVLPVFHLGTPFTHLDDLCTRYRYVALGGMVPYSSQKAAVARWLDLCFQIGAERDTRFHGFGQTTVAPLAAFPFYSVDSSTWSSGARYGDMVLWDEDRERLVRLQTGDPAAASVHADLLRSHGAPSATVGRRGFGYKSRRSAAHYCIEEQLARGVPAVAYDRLGRWLQRRHQVAPPPGWTSTGTALFLADTVLKHFRHAAAAIYDDHAREHTR